MERKPHPGQGEGRARPRGGVGRAHATPRALQSFPPRTTSLASSQSEAAAMTTGPNRILDEFAKLMTDAAGAAQGVRREVETAFRAQAERILNSMDVVQREEFEAVRDMALKTRAQNEELAARLAALEEKLGVSAADAEAKKPAARPRAKKSA